ncbi:MAG: threonylcarbamoyl-AMP synthase [Anaerolineales bacterium]|nr:threonylcarbamoyl-AMP synthase [Anaerolineales bacterium]
MKTQVVSTTDKNAVQLALQILQAGGVVAFPTDTVYGLGAIYSDPDAVLKLYDAKDRPGEKAIPILGADLDSLAEVAAGLNDATRLLAKKFWPGPLTLLVPRAPSVPDEVSSYSTVAVRVPDLAFTRDLLVVCGPLAVTSANLSGGKSTCSAQEVFLDLNGRVDLIIDGGITPGGTASTVIDCTADKPILLREGPIALAEIEKALH